MAIVINGSGTVTGLSVGGLPDGTVDEGTLATDSVTAAKIPASLENTFVSGRKNLIINGAMRVQQRGTASVTSGYFVDRFQLSGVSASAVLTSSTPTEFPTAISVSATSGNPIVIQKIESENCQHLSGQTVTASFYAKNISNATTLYAKLSYAGSVDNFGSSTTISEQNLGALSGSWVKYTASWTVPAGGLNGLMLNILCAGTSTFTMGVTGVQLELGSTATDFEHRSYGEELALCQRYFHQQGRQGSDGYEQFVNIAAFSTTGARCAYPLPTTMRAFPSVTSNGSFQTITGLDITAIALADSGGNPSVGLNFAVSSGYTVSYAYTVRSKNDADAYLQFDAEL